MSTPAAMNTLRSIVISAVLHLPKRRVKAAIDYLGATLVVAGVVGLLLAAQMGGQQYAWGSPVIIGLAIAGVVLLTLFVLWELRTPEPILPMRLFRGSVFRVSSTMGFLIGMVLMGAMMYIPFYFQVVHGLSAAEAGFALIPIVVMTTPGSMLSGRSMMYLRRYKVSAIGGAGLAIASYDYNQILGFSTELFPDLGSRVGEILLQPLEIFEQFRAAPVSEQQLDVVAFFP